MKIGNNSEKVKKQNSESIKEVIYRFAPISRLEIAEMLQLTPPTITTNVSELIKNGFVRECATIENEPKKSDEKKILGRKPIQIDFIPEAAYVIGADTGYYGTIICLTDLRGNVIQKVIVEREENNYDDAISVIIDSVNNILQNSGIERNKILGMAVGMAGSVDTNSGILRYDALHKWENKTVAQDIENGTGLKCSVENNARCRALGTDLFSGNVLPDSFAYFLIARGLACPLVIRSRMHVGDLASAGEMGHMIIEKDGAVCPTCGKRGCLDAVASELAIKNKCIELLKTGKAQILKDICKDVNKPQMSEILMAQNKGDKAVVEVIEKAVTYMGIMLANIINLISPPAVIVDGYIMLNEQNKELFINVARENIFYPHVNGVDIKFVEFDKLRVAKGAAALAIKNYILKE